MTENRGDRRGYKYDKSSDVKPRTLKIGNRFFILASLLLKLLRLLVIALQVLVTLKTIRFKQYKFACTLPMDTCKNAQQRCTG